MPAQAGHRGDGSAGDEDLAVRAVAQEKPVGAEVDQGPLDDVTGDRPQPERRAAARGTPFDERDARSFGTGAVGHLGVAVAALLGRPLPVEVVEESLPAHTSALYVAADGAEELSTGSNDRFTCCLMLFSVLRMHSSSESPHPARGLAVLVCVATAAFGTGWALLVVLRDALAALGSPGLVSADELVVATSATCALVLLLWVALGLLVSVVATLPGGLGAAGARFVGAVAPVGVRRFAAVLLGVSVLGAGLPGAANAGQTTGVLSVSAVAPAPDWLPAVSDGMSDGTADARVPAPAPEWTPTPVRALPSVTLTAPRTTTSDEENREVTVRRGDTLWDLAAAHLSPDASDAEVAAAWQRWFETNRAVIGPDPDLILPGQVLLVPAGHVSTGGSR